MIIIHYQNFGCLLFHEGGQIDGERCALILVGFEDNFAIMGFHQGIGYGKAETGAAFGLFVRYKRKKNFIGNCWRQPPAIVGNADVNHTVFDS